MTDVAALIDRYNDAWNRHDVDAICALHAPGMVFENHTAGERADPEDVAGHIASIFANWPDLRFEARRIYATPDLAVCEWTAHATRDGTPISWPGVDVFPIRDGLIARKDVYSASARR
jgi:ketosteroid isomerase-like protein